MAKVKAHKSKRTTNGKGTKVVKDYHKGALPKNEHDTASRKVHAKYGTMGDGPKKQTRVRIKH
jgi:hypothetical protein